MNTSMYAGRGIGRKLYEERRPRDDVFSPRHTPSSSSPFPPSSDPYESALERNKEKLSLQEIEDRKREAEEEEREKELLRKQMEEELFQERVKAAFVGINSIESLLNMKETYKLKANSLENLLQKSVLRESEILRNKNRNRDGFRDPTMIENRKLQEDVKRKIAEVTKFLVEIDKKLRQFQKAMKPAIEESAPEESDKQPNNYEAQLLQNSLISTTGVQDEEEEEEEDEYESTNQTLEYYDPGSHWCRDCDKLIPKIGEYFDHLHTRDHWKFVTNDPKIWNKPKRAQALEGFPRPMNIQKTKTPIKGAQFLVPIRGYYCPLCSQYLGDNNSAEEHLKSAKHNRIFLRFTYLNIDYEHKWNSDKGKALSRHQMNEKKRLKEEEAQKEAEKRKKEELQAKEEKEAKRRKAEEEHRRKEKERARDRARDSSSSERERKPKPKYGFNDSKTNDRFRLKAVTMDLSDKKEKSSKEKHSKHEREKHRKRKRHFSSSDSSDSDSPNTARRKKRTYFGDPYEDPKLKIKTFVPLNRLNRKTGRKFNCQELIDLIESAKLKPKPAHNQPIKMEFNNDEEFESNELKSNINDILKNIGDDENNVDITSEQNKRKSGDKNGNNDDNDKSDDNEKDDNRKQSDNKEDDSDDEKGNNKCEIKTETIDSEIVNDNSVEDISETSLVIDTSAKENTNDMNVNKDNDENETQETNEKRSDFNSETVLAANDFDDSLDNSRCDAIDIIVKNDVSLSSVADNDSEPNELM